MVLVYFPFPKPFFLGYPLFWTPEPYEDISLAQAEAAAEPAELSVEAAEGAKEAADVQGKPSWGGEESWVDGS